MLEVGKNYEIKQINNLAGLTLGIYRITFVSTNGKCFRVEGEDLSHTTKWYSFTRLLSFGDEVIFARGTPNTKWKHWFYIGENQREYFLVRTDQENNFEDSGVMGYDKSDFTIRLKSAEPEKAEPKLTAEAEQITALEEQVSLYKQKIAAIKDFLK